MPGIVGRPGGEGLCKDKALLLPSRSLTLLLEESQKRGEVPAHENHHGAWAEGLVPAAAGALLPPTQALPIVPRRCLPSRVPARWMPADPSSLSPSSSARRENAWPAKEEAPEQLPARGKKPDPEDSCAVTGGDSPSCAHRAPPSQETESDGPSSGLPAHPSPPPPPPTHSMAGRDPFC